MNDAEFLETQVRGLERENRALRMTLWDRYFMAAIGGCLHHGAKTGTAMAAEVADNMLAERDRRCGQPEKRAEIERGGR